MHFDLTLLTNLGNVSGRKETLPGRVVTRRHRTNCDLDFIGFKQFNSQTYAPHNVSFMTFRLQNFGCDVNPKNISWGWTWFLRWILEEDAGVRWTMGRTLE